MGLCSTPSKQVRPFSPISFSDTELIDFYVPFDRTTEARTPLETCGRDVRRGRETCAKRSFWNNARRADMVLPSQISIAKWSEKRAIKMARFAILRETAKQTLEWANDCLFGS